MKRNTGKRKRNCLYLFSKLTIILFHFQDDSVIENIIALGFLFVTTPLKMRGVSIKIIEKLIYITIHSNRPVITKNAMQVLTNFAAAPSIKQNLEENYLEQIQNINTHGDPDLQKFKNRLIRIITHRV